MSAANCYECRKGHGPNEFHADDCPKLVRSAAKRRENKILIALLARAAMREVRKGKPTVFDAGYWPKRWSDPTYLGDGPYGP